MTSFLKAEVYLNRSQFLNPGDVWSQKWKQSWSTWAICSGAQQRANPQLPVVESLFATFCEDPWRLEHLTLNSVSIINAFLRSCHSHSLRTKPTSSMLAQRRHSWSCITIDIGSRFGIESFDQVGSKKLVCWCHVCCTGIVIVLCTCSSCLSERTECLQDGAMWQVNLRGSKPGIAELYEGHDGADDADTVRFWNFKLTPQCY